MPRGAVFRSKARSARLGTLQVGALPKLDSCRESARGAFATPSFGNRPFTIPVDFARRRMRICPDWRRKPGTPVPP
jgi:hypothetical protein